VCIFGRPICSKQLCSTVLDTSEGFFERCVREHVGPRLRGHSQAALVTRRRPVHNRDHLADGAQRGPPFPTLFFVAYDGTFCLCGSVTVQFSLHRLAPYLRRNFSLFPALVLPPFYCAGPSVVHPAMDWRMKTVPTQFYFTPSPLQLRIGVFNHRA